MCDSEDCDCPPCECFHCALEREGLSMWADFLAHAAADEAQLNAAVEAAIDHKPLGIA